jgi:nudix-type nucleoside diphosphatase (YffH/AdpP family)
MSLITVKGSKQERVRIKSVETLSEDWSLLKKTTFELHRRDGSWQRQSRETYDRGNGATILLYNLERKTVVLTRQFRFAAYGNGHSGMLIEAPAGLLDEASPEDRIRAEAEEETGYRVSHVRKIFEAFMSPGSATERLYFFVAEYGSGSRATLGGGNRKEGEDIEVLEWTIDDAMTAIETDEIQDGKRSCFFSTPSSTFSRTKEPYSDVQRSPTAHDFDCRTLPLRDWRRSRIDGSQSAEPRIDRSASL